MTTHASLMAHLQLMREGYQASLKRIADFATKPGWDEAELGQRVGAIEIELLAARGWLKDIASTEAKVLKERRRLFRKEHGIGPREKVDPDLLRVKFGPDV